MRKIKNQSSSNTLQISNQVQTVKILSGPILVKQNIKIIYLYYAIQSKEAFIKMRVIAEQDQRNYHSSSKQIKQSSNTINKSHKVIKNIWQLNKTRLRKIIHQSQFLKENNSAQNFIMFRIK